MSFNQLNEDVILIILQFWPRRFDKITRKIVNNCLEDELFVIKVKESWLTPETNFTPKITIKKSLFPLNHVLRNITDSKIIDCYPSLKTYINNDAFVQIKRNIRTIVNKNNKNYFPCHNNWYCGCGYPYAEFRNLKHLCKIYLENNDLDPPNIQHLQAEQVVNEEFIKIFNLP